MTLNLLAPTSLPDVNEAGRIIGELQGFNLLFFVMLFLIVVLVIALLWAFGKVAKAVEAVVGIREALNTLSTVTLTAGNEAANNRNKLERITEVVKRIEAEVEKIE